MDERFKPLTEMHMNWIDPDHVKDLSLYARAEVQKFNDELIDESNVHAIEEMLKQYVENGEVYLNENSMYVKVWGAPDKLETTEAYGEVVGILDQMENYPLLDEDDHSQREWRKSVEDVERDFKSLVRDDAPEGWREMIAAWYSEKGERYADASGNHEIEIEVLRDLQLAKPEVLYDELKEKADEFDAVSVAAKQAVDELNRAIDMSARQFAEYKAVVPTRDIDSLMKQLIDSVQRLKEQRMDILLNGLVASTPPSLRQMSFPRFKIPVKKPDKKDKWKLDLEREKKERDLKMRQEMAGKSRSDIEQELERAEATYDAELRRQKLVQLKARLTENKRIRDAISYAVAHPPEVDMEEFMAPEPGTDLFASTLIRFPA